MTDEELHRRLSVARTFAEGLGLHHELWDIVLEGEAILARQPSLLTRPMVEEYLEKHGFSGER